MNNFLRLSLINQINFSEFIISHTTQKRKMRTQCSKKHNLLLVIFYAKLNNFSGLQSCNLLYLYVAQISCLTLAQRVLTACRDLTCWKMHIGFVVFLVIYISYQIELLCNKTLTVHIAKQSFVASDPLGDATSLSKSRPLNLL